jgi:hypothetical protein
MSALSRGTADMSTKELTRRSTPAKIRSHGAAPAEADVSEPARVDVLAGDEQVDPAPHLGHLLDDPVTVRRLEADDILDGRARIERVGKKRGDAPLGEVDRFG